MSDSQQTVTEHGDEVLPEEDASSETPPTLYHCCSCEIDLSVDEAYRCQTCTDEDSDLSHPVNFFCDHCVTSGHIRKQHVIRDGHLREVTVCTVHKNLCQMFCETCDELLCPVCLKTHKSHTFTPVETKAKDVRSEVFNLLDDLEKKEKFALVERREKLETVDQKVEKMKTDIMNSLKSKLAPFDNLKTADSENAASIRDLQGSLRELLSFSASVAVGKFSKIEETYEAVSEEFSSVNKELYESTQVTDFVKIVKTEFLKSLKLHEIKKFSDLEREAEEMVAIEEPFETQTQHFYLHFENFQNCFYRVERFEEILRVRKLIVNVDLTLEVVESFEFTPPEMYKSISKVFPFGNKDILIALDNERLIVFKLRSKKFEYMPYPENFENLIWPVENAGALEWIYRYFEYRVYRICWRTPSNKLSSSDNCASEVKMSSSLASVVCLVDSCEDIKYVEESGEKINSILIKNAKHRLSSVDCVSVPDKDTLFVWSLDIEAVAVFRRIKNEWSLANLVPWEDEDSYIDTEIDGRSYRLVPFIKEKDDDPACSQPILKKRYTFFVIKL